MTEYWGNYEKDSRQVILHQTKFEKFSNWCYICALRLALLPYGVMAVGLVTLYVLVNILERRELALPVLCVFGVLTLICLAPIILDLVLGMLSFGFVKKHALTTLRYIASHHMCTYNDIVQNTSALKVYRFFDHLMSYLQQDLKIVTLINDSGQTFYRIATEEDLMRWSPPEDQDEG